MSLIQQKKIVWELLYDPLPDIDERDEEEDDEDDEDEDEYGNVNESPRIVFEGPNMPTMVPTPFGPCPINDPLNPRRLYEFWVGHTNFPLTVDDIDKIKRTPGVEQLLFTRYKMVVGFGKLFDFRNVRASIQNELYGTIDLYDEIDEIKHPEVKAAVAEVINELSKNYRLWAVYVFPNGKVQTAMSNNEDGGSDWLRELAILKEAKTQSGGMLFVCNYK